MRFSFFKNNSFFLVLHSLIFVLLSASLFPQQRVLKIICPSDAGSSVSVMGYNYFDYDTIGSAKLDENGYAAINHNYKGFALITISNTKQYPIILNAASNTLNIISDEKVPVFENDVENNLLFRYLIAKDNILRKTMAVEESLNNFQEGDPVYAVILSEKAKLEMTKNVYAKNLTDSAQYFASTLMLAKELMETTYNIKTYDELNDRKASFIDFIKSNLKTLRHSDMLQQLGSQYVMMNEYVVIGQNNHYEQVLKDVDDWVKAFGKEIGTKPIVEFFMNAYAGRSMLGMAGRVAANYQKEISCKVNIKKVSSKDKNFADIDIRLSKGSANTAKLKSIPSSYKILYFFKNDCPAALVQNVILSRYMSSKMLQIPVFTIFESNAQNTVNLLGRIKPEAFYYAEDKSIFKLARVKKAPFYILLNKDNKIKKKFKDIEKLKKYLEEKINK